jgi:hypothetical protein
MPKRELAHPHQIIAWLEGWGARLDEPAELTLIGSGGLLWHVHRRGGDAQLPENSMDVDPVTSSQAVAELAYEAMIGSPFELEHGWHVNLMPDMVLDSLPTGWEDRSEKASYGNLTVVVPSPADLLAPKLLRKEPRDLAHAQFARDCGLIATDHGDD